MSTLQPDSLQSLLTAYGVLAVTPVFTQSEGTTVEGMSAAIAGQSAGAVDTGAMDAAWSTLSRWYRLALPQDADLQTALAAFLASPDIEIAEPNFQWALTDTIPYPIEGIPDSTTDPDIDQQWYLAGTHTQEAWNYLRLNGIYPGGSHDVIVAVIDTGVDATHPELAGSMWTNPGEIPGNGIDDDHDGFVDDIHGCNVVGDPRTHSGDSSDMYGHGTHVAGIIAAQAYDHLGGAGVAFNVQIMSIRAAQYNGTLTVDDIAEGIVYAINHGAEVINMSFGGYQHSQIIEDTLAMGLNQAVLVAAAGNDGLNGWEHPFYPAALPFVHGVEATTATGGLAWFSNYGYDMAAPGESIYSTLPGNQYAAWSGTSMATPIVSGAAALLRSFFWQRDIYSSRYLMGALEAGCQAGPIDIYTALTTPPTPGVTVLDNWLFDDKGIAAGNDADGRADAGETLNIAVELMNRSGLANNVVGTLRAYADGAAMDDPYVTISTPTITFGNIGPFNTSDNGFIYDSGGVIVGVQRPFVFTVSPDCPNDHVIPFELTTTFLDGWDPGHEPYTRVSRFNYVVQRGRNVPTVITAGTTFELTPDQYWMVAGPVLVEAGATLIVRPGTTVQWGAVSSDPYNPGPQSGYIVVRGTMSVQGTQDQPIIFLPSYLVSGQKTTIQVDGGTADLQYVTIRNPDLHNLRNVDHAYFDWDAFSTYLTADTISNTVFHRLLGGGTLYAGAYDTVLFDDGTLGPLADGNTYSPSIQDSVFLQDNLDNAPLSLTFATTTTPAQLGFDPATNQPNHLSTYCTTYDGKTYVLLFQTRPDVPGFGHLWPPSIEVAESVANYYGGHVTSIHDSDEQNFLFSWVQSFYFQQRGWTVYDIGIGLTDRGHAGTFTWMDGSPVTYTNWAPGFPVTHGPNVEQVVQFAFLSAYSSEADWQAWQNVTQNSWYPGHYAGFILELPGELTAQQLNGPMLDGAVLQYVRNNCQGSIQGDIRYNAFLSKYWDPNVSHWMRFYSTPNAPGYYCTAIDNYWGTTTTSLIDHAIVDYYDNFTSARLDYGTPPAQGFASTWPFAQQVLINGVPVDTVPTVGSGPAIFSITFNRDMDPTVQPYVTFGPSAPCTDFTVKPTGQVEALFDVELSLPNSRTVTVAYETRDGTALAGVDYQATSGTLTFEPGQTRQTVHVPIIGDIWQEPDKQFSLHLGDPTVVAIVDGDATGTITNDDTEVAPPDAVPPPEQGAPQIIVQNVSIREDDDGTAEAVFAVRLSANPSSTVTVDYATADGSATAWQDYRPIRGTLTWQPGEPLDRTVTVPILGDVLDEPDETFTLNLSRASHAVIANDQAVGTILDDEPVVTIDNVSIVEGDAGQADAVFMVRVSGDPARDVVVHYATANGTATAGLDYTPTSGMLTFTQGGPLEQTIAVPVFGDTVNETNETFLVALSGAAGAKITDGGGLGTIIGDDGPLVSIEDATFPEGDSGTVNRAFTVSISADPPQRVVVHYRTEDGTAVAGSDYQPVDATLVFDPGQPLQQTILVPILGDTISEADETFSVVLTSATVVAISDDRATGTIANDDPLVSIDDVSIVEGATGAVEMHFTVSISIDPPDNVTLTYATAAQTATQGTDYLAASGALTFTPGGPRQQTITVNVLGDVANEVHETFAVQLGNLVNANFAKDRGIGTIMDDDGPKIVIGDASVTEGDSGTVNATFTVSLTEPTTQPITVNWATKDVSATAGLDYTAASGTLTFQPGGATSQQVTVQVKGDTVDEVDETFLVQLSGAVGTPILDASGEGTIFDDDTATLSVGDVTVAEGYNGWVNSRTWQGSFYMTPVTGEGYQLMRISGAAAADDPWLVSGYDVGRYRFQVKTMGVASMNLQAAGQEGSIRLSWQQNDYDLLAGYNLYRSDSLTGTYTKINSTIIPKGSEFFVDTNVSPAVPKYYKFTVVTTSMTESNYSNIASAAAVDTIAPVVTHTPATSAKPGFGLQLSATVTDNVAVQGVTLNYRLAGSGGAYTTLAMVNVSGTSWVATIPGSAVQPPGVEYYLSATDGIGQTYSGTPAAPHTVVVTNTPTLNSAGPNQGPIGGGTTVSLSGTMFQQGATVLFGTAPAGDVVVLADNQITCVTPSHIPELVDITVTNPDGTHATLLHGFTFVDQGVVVSLPTVSGDHGAIVEVPISVSNVNGLTAADISITFASGVLSAQSVRVGNLTAGWTLSANRATPGTVTISMASAMAVTGSGVLAYITFQVNGAPTTQTALTVASALLNDGTVTCALSPGNFTVNGLFSVAGSVTYFTGNGPVPGTDLSLVGVGVLSASSGSNGAFSFSGVPTGAYTLAPAKDDDVDQITAYDASLVLQAAAGMLTLSSNQRVAADVNGNGLVNSMDAYYILQKSVGLLDVPFPGAGTVWDFVPASRSYSLLNSNQTGQNFTAILVGDVSGNWVYVAGGSGQTMMGLTAEEEPPAASLSLPTIEATSTQRVVLPLQIDPASAEVYSADLVLTYDPAVLSLQGVNAGGAAADMGYAFNTSQPGTIRAGFAGAQPLAAGGTLMELVFDVVGTLQTPAVVSLATAELNEGQVDATAQDGLVRDTLAPCTTAVRMNGDSARGAGALDPSGAGIRQIAVGFTEAVNFAGGVHVQKVTFNNGQEIIGETVGAVTLNGSGTGTMTLSLDPLSVIDTWLKVTLDAGSVSDRAGNALAGGTGGATSFYVGSLRGDFNGDGYVTAADKAGFMAAWNAGSLDADFRGVGYGVRPPDGKITLGDIDGFTSVYLGAVAAGRHLDPLPAGGGPLATGVTPLPGIGRIDGFDVMTAAGQLPMAAGVAWSASDSGDSEDADTPDILAATEPVSADLATLLVVSQPASAAALRI